MNADPDDVEEPDIKTLTIGSEPGHPLDLQSGSIETY